MKYILIYRISWNFTLDDRTHRLIFDSLSRGDTPPRPTFPSLLSHNLLVELWVLCLHYCLPVLRLMSNLKQGPRPNMHSWAPSPYNYYLENYFQF